MLHIASNVDFHGSSFKCEYIALPTGTWLANVNSLFTATTPATTITYLGNREGEPSRRNPYDGGPLQGGNRRGQPGRGGHPQRTFRELS